MGVHVREQLVLGGVGDVVPEDLGKELVRSGQVLLAVAEEDAGPLVERRLGHVGHQGGLAYTGFTGDEQHFAPLAFGDPLDGGRQQLELGRTADHRHGGTHRQPAGEGDGCSGIDAAQWCPEHFDRLDRIGQALQDHLAEWAAFVAVASSSRQPCQFGGQDLPALAEVTESGRLDDRVPEVVVVVPGDLAGAHSHPQAHRVLVATVVLVDTLLHRHPARQRG